MLCSPSVSCALGDLAERTDTVTQAEIVNLFAQLGKLGTLSKQAAAELQALFELCVARGVIGRDEYLDRIR